LFRQAVVVRYFHTIMKPSPITFPFATLLLAMSLATSPLFGQESTRKILVRVPADYPALLQNKRIGGLVKVRVVVTPAGTVRTTELVGGNPILAEAAITAIKKWRYERADGDTASIVEIRFDPH